MKAEAILSAIRSHCLDKEGAVEDNPWDHTAWKVKGKLFAIGSEDSPLLTVKSTLDQQTVLIQHPCIEKAAYVGRYGWVTIKINDAESLELAKDLIDESYDLVAPKRRPKAVSS